MSEPHDCGGDAAAYVLGALEPGEARTFERHLESCAVCRDEVDALQGVVHALPMAAPQYAPPRRLRRRVMRAVRAERKQRRPPRLVVWPAVLRSALRVPIGALAAAAVTAAGIVAGLELTGGASPRVVQARIIGVSGSAKLQLVGDHGELIVSHLTPPPPDHIYEVWLKRPGGPPTPTGVLFSVTSSGNAYVGLPRGLRGISTVMVTPEPAGGSPHPTHSPVIVAQVS